MHPAIPSRTALRVALRRAAHQLHDAAPLVFDDPLAFRILGKQFQDELQRTPNSARRPHSAAMRAWMVARARLAEDTLAASLPNPSLPDSRPQQYLILGAGLDTFACRNPFSAVRVFEVDHPATQAWKLDMLAAAKILPPDTANFVAVDFERDSLLDRLQAAGFDAALPTVTAWLGVVPYLTLAAFRATAALLGTFAPGSRVVFDYAQPRHALPPVEQWMQDSLGARVALAGEPFQVFFTPPQLAQELHRAGLRVLEDLGAESLMARYFQGRTDGLKLRGEASRVCVAASIHDGRAQAGKVRD
jgi:methyltransferase (TIGR00027 family)